MMKKHYLKLLFICICLLSMQFSHAQECPYIPNAVFGGDATPPTCNGVAKGTATLTNGGYANVSVTCGNVYTFSLCEAGIDTQMDLWSENGNIILASSDDDCGLQSTITWTATFTGIVEVHMAEYFLSIVACDVDQSANEPLEVTCTNGTCTGDCLAGELSSTANQIVCGLTETFTISTDGTEVIPNGPSPGYAYLFSPGDGSSCNSAPGTGGNDVGFTIFNSDPAGETWDSDLGGILSANSFPVLEGEWIISGITYTDNTDIDQTTCSITSTSLAVCFYTAANCPVSCDFPVASATPTYDCFTSELTINLSNAGIPTDPASPYVLTLTGGASATPLTVSGTGDYTFTGLTSNSTYTVTADDGNGCVVILGSVLADCPCQNPVGTATYDCFTDEMTVSISNAGVTYDPTNPYIISVTGGPSVAGQAITGTGDYTFTGLSGNLNYTITVNNGIGCNATLSTLFADCACLAPVGTATYDCAGDFIELNITNTGAPIGAFNASIDGGTPVNINSTGPINFTGLAQDQTYNLVFDDGMGCTSDIPYIYNGCRVLGNNCTSAMSNGGFEGNNSLWDETVTDGNGINANFNTIVNSDLPLSGTNSAVFGGYGGSGLGTGSPYTSSLERETLSGGVLLPSGDIITLYLWILVDACTPGDQFTITVDGNVVLSINGASSQCGEDKWREYAIDLSAYADGMRHPLVFQLIENSTISPTRIYVDNILVESCTPIVCPPNYTGGSAIFGSPADQTDYETDGSILSIQTIAAGTTIDYDSGTDITLGIAGSSGFEVQLGATFCAFIDGCNGTGGAVLLTDGNTNSLQADESEKTPIIYSTKETNNKTRSLIQGEVYKPTLPTPPTKYMNKFAPLAKQTYTPKRKKKK